LIKARGRSNYAEAAGYLKRVERLLTNLQDSATWEQYIAEIRQQKPRLPALLDELKQAGL